MTDLPDEILLTICEYLRPVDALRAFLSKDTSDRFHRLIVKYRTHVNLSVLSYSEFRYMIDTVLPQLDPSDLVLNNLHIPCLVDQFISSSCNIRSIQISSLHLNGDININYLLLAWLSQLSKLEELSFDNDHKYEWMSTPADHVNLRDFVFVNGLSPTANKLNFYTTFGLVLHNELNSLNTSQIKDASLRLNTINDLQILLNKGFLGNVSTLNITLKTKQEGRKLRSTTIHHYS